MLRKVLVGFIVTLLFVICVGASEQTHQDWDDYLKYYYSQSPEKREEIWDAMTEDQRMSLYNAQEREWDSYYETHFKGLSSSAQDEILEQMNTNQKASLERAIERASQSPFVIENMDEFLDYYKAQNAKKRQEIWDAMTEVQRKAFFDVQEREWDSYYESYFKELSSLAQDEILEQMDENQKAALERAIERANQPSLVFDSIEDIDEYLDYYQGQDEERQKALWDRLSDDQKVMVTQRGWDKYLEVFETFSKEQKEEIVSQMSHEELIALGEAMIRSAGTSQASYPRHSPLFESMEEQEAYQKWYKSLTEKQRENAVFQDPKIKDFLDAYIWSLESQATESQATGVFGGGSIIISTEAESTAIPLGPGEEIAPPPQVDY